MKILIQNGRVIDPATGRDERADIAIAAGRILSVGQVPADFHPNRTIDAAGLVVAPGLVDLAARLREPGQAAGDRERLLPPLGLHHPAIAATGAAVGGRIVDHDAAGPVQFPRRARRGRAGPLTDRVQQRRHRPRHR